jgi:hypothetical protein
MNDKKILELFDSNIQGKFSYLPSHIEHMEVKIANNMLLIDSGLPSNMFNIICCHGEVDRVSVQATIEHFRLKKLPYAFWIGFENDPPWLEEELLALDLVTDETEWAMVCDLDEQKSIPVYSNFDIRQVQDLAGLQDIISVINNFTH